MTDQKQVLIGEIQSLRAHCQKLELAHEADTRKSNVLATLVREGAGEIMKLRLKIDQLESEIESLEIDLALNRDALNMTTGQYRQLNTEMREVASIAKRLLVE